MIITIHDSNTSCFHFLATEEGCRHCLPGWTFMNSLCYYFRLSEDISRRSWQDARNFCKKQGGDLVIIDTREKHVSINISDQKSQIPFSIF